MHWSAACAIPNYTNSHKNNHFPLIQTKTEVKSESAITKKKYMFL